MQLIRKSLLLAAGLGLSLGLAGGAQAAYKCQDDKGRTVYSDIPCAMKPPPAPKEAVRISKPEPVVVALTKISEADVLRVITLAEDYTRMNNAGEMCNLFTDDLKFKLDNQLLKPPKTIAGGKTEMCTLAREGAEQSKRTGMISQFERGPTKVTIEAGETRASAVYEQVIKVTRYDRIISTYRCSSKDQFSLVAGKLLFSAGDAVCKP